MKKILVFVLSILVLSGCTHKDTVIQQEDRVAISQTDFTEEDAKSLVEHALKQQYPERESTVVDVVIKGNNVYGIYTYNKKGKELRQQVSLYSVSRNKNDMDDILYLQSSFGAVDQSTLTMIEEKEIPVDNTVEQPESTKEKEFDLPNVVADPDSASSKQATEIQNGDGLYIVRFYLNAGKLDISGKHTGEGSFVVKLYDLEQNVVSDMVDIEGYGEYDQSVEVPVGYYYLIAKISGGKFDMNYAY